jgi:molybdopterin biosynthesis enzyme MoaB
MLGLMSADESWPLKIHITATALVPDNIGKLLLSLSTTTTDVVLYSEMIQAQIRTWSASDSAIDTILTTGGTGFGPRDLTPEAIKPLLHRDAPGVAQALLNEGLKYTPLAVMSRPVVGTIHQTLICTLPGRYVDPCYPTLAYSCEMVNANGWS